MFGEDAPETLVVELAPDIAARIEHEKEMQEFHKKQNKKK
jgi:hypothetical protein